MAISRAMEVQREQAVPAACLNSPLAYGLGSFGLESTYKVFWGFCMFFHGDGLGLVVALTVVSIVLGFLPEAADVSTQVTLLSIGLFALALAALQKEQ